MLLSGEWVVLLTQIVFVASTLIILVCLLTLFGLRLSRGLIESRNQRSATETRGVLLDHLLGDWMEAATAAANLDRREGRDWERAEKELLTMVNKLRGESRDRAIDLLEQRGAIDRAVDRLGSSRAVNRCRAAHTLGVLNARDHIHALTSLLDDSSPLVRRVAVRALGALGDPSTAPPVVAAGEADERLRSDVAMALTRMGPGAVPHLSETLARAIAYGRADDTGAPLLATVLGQIGDHRAVDVLCDAVASPDRGLRIAAARALGCLEDPRAVPVLTAALEDADADQQVAVATALGRIGATDAIADLLRIVDHGDAASARSAAAAVLRLGPEGRSALDASPSPHAVEALALATLREDR